MKPALPLVVAVLAVAALAGCAPEAPVVIPEPDPTSTPIFESDEEALAAAEVAYGEYLRVVDEILGESGKNPDRIDAVAGTELAQLEKEGFAAALDSGQRGVGDSKFDSMELQQFDPSAEEGDIAVSVYACLDLSDRDVLDATGKSVVPPDRQNRVPMELGFAPDPTSSAKLLLYVADIWTGDDFCD